MPLTGQRLRNHHPRLPPELARSWSFVSLRATFIFSCACSFPELATPPQASSSRASHALVVSQFVSDLRPHAIREPQHALDPARRRWWCPSIATTPSFFTASSSRSLFTSSIPANPSAAQRQHSTSKVVLYLSLAFVVGPRRQ